MDKHINKMTVEEFRQVPCRGSFNTDVGEFDSLVILPDEGEELHESGYRFIDFVAVREGEPVCRLSGCSDVLHINGIGGMGHDWVSKRGVPTMTEVHGWTFDCLPTSGLLKLMCPGRMLFAGAALSSFEIFATERRPYNG